MQILSAEADQGGEEGGFFVGKGALKDAGLERGEGCLDFGALVAEGEEIVTVQGEVGELIGNAALFNRFDIRDIDLLGIAEDRFALTEEAGVSRAKIAEHKCRRGEVAIVFSKSGDDR